MSETLNGREALEHHNEDYGLIDRDTAECLRDYLDEIIDSGNGGEGAYRHTNTEVLTSDWREIDGILADIRPFVLYPLALSSIRFDIRRDIFKSEGSRPSPEEGDAYTIILERLFHRNGITEDDSYSKTFKLVVPKDPTVEDAGLMFCFEPSLITSSVDGQPADIDTVVSSFREVDVKLHNSFYEWQRGTTYDAEQLFDELMLVEAEASSRGNPTNTLN
ncbi:MAG: hypothetical protein ABI354_01635 [Candidatus Saccharimonadales bacterium]